MPIDWIWSFPTCSAEETVLPFTQMESPGGNGDRDGWGGKHGWWETVCTESYFGSCLVLVPTRHLRRDIPVDGGISKSELRKGPERS